MRLRGRRMRARCGGETGGWGAVRAALPHELRSCTENAHLFRRGVRLLRGAAGAGRGGRIEVRKRHFFYCRKDEVRLL